MIQWVYFTSVVAPCFFGSGHSGTSPWLRTNMDVKSQSTLLLRTAPFKTWALKALKNLSPHSQKKTDLVDYFYFEASIQLMVNCWFGLVVWIPGTPLGKGLLLGCTPIRIPNHRATDQQSTIRTISWSISDILSHSHLILRLPRGWLIDPLKGWRNELPDGIEFEHLIG